MKVDNSDQAGPVCCKLSTLSAKSCQLRNFQEVANQLLDEGVGGAPDHLLLVFRAALCFPLPTSRKSKQMSSPRFLKLIEVPLLL